MRTLPPRIVQNIEKREDDWVAIANDLAASLSQKRQEKERQLRNIQSIAEESDSWAALSLFIRYQAAREKLDIGWAEEAVGRLERLGNEARQLAGNSNADVQRQIHMELIARVIGYTVRRHVWDNKMREARQ